MKKTNQIYRIYTNIIVEICSTQIFYFPKFGSEKLGSPQYFQKME